MNTRKTSSTRWTIDLQLIDLRERRASVSWYCNTSNFRSSDGVFDELSIEKLLFSRFKTTIFTQQVDFTSRNDNQIYSKRMNRSTSGKISRSENNAIKR
jgi:hypothetical protein